MKIKPYHIPLLLLVVTTAFSIAWSCKKDPCIGVTCMHGGACLDGNCVCPLGYEATDCHVQTRLKFEGEFVGDGSDNKQAQYHEWHCQFIASGDSAMKMDIMISDSGKITTWPMKLSIDHDLRGYVLTPATFGGIVYSGVGTLGTSVASLELTKISTTPADTTTILFDNLIKQ